MVFVVRLFHCGDDTKGPKISGVLETAAIGDGDGKYESHVGGLKNAVLCADGMITSSTLKTTQRRLEGVEAANGPVESQSWPDSVPS